MTTSTKKPSSEPRIYVWLVPGRLAVAERPGRGGRSHRRALRDSETRWWREQGVTTVVSGMRSRHGLIEYALEGLAIRWAPLRDLDDDGPAQLRELVATAIDALEVTEGAVLVHCDRANEWLAAIDAALRVALDLSEDVAGALAAVQADGLPVGSIATALVGGTEASAP
ncbi:MAG: hypothetical protein ACR2N6_04510 [Miltoncostaeaceae bacterium]